MRTFYALAAAALAVVLSACGQTVAERMDQCDQAWEDYVLAPGSTPEQPAILSENWCAEHLSGLDLDGDGDHG